MKTSFPDVLSFSVIWSVLLFLFLQSIDGLLGSIDSILKIILDTQGWLFIPVFPSATLLGALKVRDKGEWSTAVFVRVK